MAEVQNQGICLTILPWELAKRLTCRHMLKFYKSFKLNELCLSIKYHKYDMWVYPRLIFGLPWILKFNMVTGHSLTHLCLLTGIPFSSMIPCRWRFSIMDVTCLRWTTSSFKVSLSYLSFFTPFKNFCLSPFNKPSSSLTSSISERFLLSFDEPFNKNTALPLSSIRSTTC